MKKYTIALIICLFSGLGYSQNIKEFSSYTKAMSEFSSNPGAEKIMMIYYLDGKSSKLEKTINKKILKSDILKQFNKDVVLLKIDSSKELQNQDYNSRALMAYNHKNIFPSMIVYIPGHRKSLPLQTNFSDEAIAQFLSDIKSL